MPKNTNFLKSSGGKKEDDSHFIPLSDIMTALMLLFLLISVVYMIKVDESVRIPRIFKEISQGLSEKLGAEFQTDLKAWGAVIDKDLTVRFTEPDILFKTGSAALSPRFQEILDDFFPRYLKIMMEKEFVNNIEEIRIEGHTSSFWGDLSGDEAYFKNMELSQERTRAVLSYLLNSNLSRSQKEWLRKHFRAIGFASARPLNAMGEPLQKGEVEHALNSQRVEFRVRTNIEERIADIVERRDASALEALELPQKPQIELIGANSHGFDGGDSSVNSGENAGNLGGNLSENSVNSAVNSSENFGENSSENSANLGGNLSENSAGNSALNSSENSANFAGNFGENSSVNSNKNSAGNSVSNSANSAGNLSENFGKNSANLGGNSSENSALNSSENSQKKAKNPPKRKSSNTSVIIAATLAVVAILIALILKFVVFRKKNNDWEMLEKSAISKENSNSNSSENSVSNLNTNSNSSENSAINSNANSNSSENLAKNSNANSSVNSNANSSVNSNLSENAVSNLNTNSNEKPTSNSTENSTENSSPNSTPQNSVNSQN